MLLFSLDFAFEVDFRTLYKCFFHCFMYSKKKTVSSSFISVNGGFSQHKDLFSDNWSHTLHSHSRFSRLDSWRVGSRRWSTLPSVLYCRQLLEFKAFERES